MPRGWITVCPDPASGRRRGSVPQRSVLPKGSDRNASLAASCRFWVCCRGLCILKSELGNQETARHRNATIPLGGGLGKILRPPRSVAEKLRGNIRCWTQAKNGDHFAAVEPPEFFAKEIREFFRLLTTG